MSTWFTSDLHLRHERIIELCNRPFRTVAEMDEAIITNWNERVEPDDTVYVLGDVALGKIAESLPLCANLNGKKLLVPGNHDRCWSGNRKIRPVDVTRYTDAGFTILPENILLAWGWRLCHFPYTGDSHDEDRYTKHRPKPATDDEILIHGHVHNSWKVNGNQINVGVDVWDFRPVHAEEIRELIDLEEVAEPSTRTTLTTSP